MQTNSKENVQVICNLNVILLGKSNNSTQEAENLLVKMAQQTGIQKKKLARYFNNTFKHFPVVDLLIISKHLNCEPHEIARIETITLADN